MAKRTTLYLGDEEGVLLRQMAAREGVSLGAIVSRALRRHFRAGYKRPQSVGAGASGREDLSERCEDLLGDRR
jgi:hypothetical protein